VIVRADIIELAKEHLEETDFFLVDVLVKPQNSIIVILDGDNGVMIEDCVAMSRHIEGSLDREEDDFDLRVMSAGIGQPFKMLRQFKKNIGKGVCVRMLDETETEGVLVKASVNSLKVKGFPAPRKKGQKPSKHEKEPEIVELDFSRVKEAKIIIKQ